LVDAQFSGRSRDTTTQFLEGKNQDA